ncbi:YdeI/OmpD-associated family protein [Fulvivirga lutimaris]|uniref:YdeI/OmpD-associated family protein n=1 Tax=Fulvivirga lutimaris TaxID=1819566 RepID=UPI0012BB9945|nr:DUF1801 domain-containing protein [Fulvivirga lutimaris]MTI39559.1 hypothetical protein [Fulvivirga lutimaris]
MNEQVDAYLVDGCGRCPLGGTPECKVNNWLKELRYLRSIVLDCGLTEELKWGVPCYTYKNANVAIVSAFKEYCSLSFFKGVLLKDSEHILVKQGDNSQSARLLKFTDVEQIKAIEDTIKAYIFEAIEVEKAGLKVDFKQKDQLEYPEELKQMFNSKPELDEAFEALTPGRKRGYIIHFTQPKQSKTRVSRIEKCIPKIMQGKGWNDR